jgi:hypothetical protein
MRPRYEELPAEKFSELPEWQSKDKALLAMSDWERSNPEALSDIEGRQEVTYGQGGIDLKPYVRPVFVRAVWDASDQAVEGRASPFGELVELLVDSKLSSLKAEILKLGDQAESDYRSLVDGHGDEPLQEASVFLSEHISRYVTNAEVSLDWDIQAPSFSLPKVRARIKEQGFIADIGRQGHGVQRAYLLAVLQGLHEQLQAVPREDRDEASLLLVVEEPELYQHPVQGRLLAKTLQALPGEGGTAGTQVLYATHSPLFVSLENIESVRLFRLDRAEVPTARVASVNLEAAAQRMWEASGSPRSPYTADTLKARLRLLLDSPVAEGFFARAVVLVEGAEDSAIVRAACLHSSLDLDQEGIAVLHVDGKWNLDRPLVVFGQLGIPIFVMFDGDASKSGEDSNTSCNRRLLSLLGEEESGTPETQVNDAFACFEENLTGTIQEEIGSDKWSDAIGEARAHFGFVGDGGEKNPIVLARVFEQLHQSGASSQSLGAIVEKIRDRLA